MGVRCTHEEVDQILGGTALLDDEVTAFIEAASVWVDANLVDACDTVSDAMLTQIEKFLAAHLCTGADPLLVSSGRGDISESYQRAGVDFSDYLRTAAAMDPCGIVAEKWMGKQRMQFRVGSSYGDDC